MAVQGKDVSGLKLTITLPDPGNPGGGDNPGGGGAPGGGGGSTTQPNKTSPSPAL